MIAGVVSAAEISALTETLQGSQTATLKHSSLIALARASALCLEGKTADNWTGLMKQEQQLAALAPEGKL